MKRRKKQIIVNVVLCIFVCLAMLFMAVAVPIIIWEL